MCDQPDGFAAEPKNEDAPPPPPEGQERGDQDLWGV